MAPPKSLRKNSIPRIIAPSKAHIAMITIWVELRRLSAMVFSAATLLKRHYPPIGGKCRTTAFIMQAKYS
jgi:hypothetical protein